MNLYFYKKKFAEKVVKNINSIDRMKKKFQNVPFLKKPNLRNVNDMFLLSKINLKWS